MSSSLVCPKLWARGIGRVKQGGLPSEQALAIMWAVMGEAMALAQEEIKPERPLKWPNGSGRRAGSSK